MKKAKRILCILVCMLLLCSIILTSANAVSDNYCPVFEEQLYWFFRWGNRISDTDVKIECTLYNMIYMDILDDYATEAQYEHGTDTGYNIPADVFEKWITAFFDITIYEVRNTAVSETSRIIYNADKNIYEVPPVGGFGGGPRLYVSGYTENSDGRYSVYAKIYDPYNECHTLEEFHSVYNRFEELVETGTYTGEIINIHGCYFPVESYLIFNIEFDGEYVKFLNRTEIDKIPEIPEMITPDTRIDSTEKFTDIESGKWYTEYIDYAATYKLMNGMTEDTFAPDDTLTRAMFVQILANIDGADTSDRNADTKFTDVPSGKWYSPAVKWASENGIVNGMTENTFEPQGNIQRQQMCVMLTRYAKQKGIELKATVEKTEFEDDGQIKPYAKEAVYACQSAGIISGMTKTTFEPSEEATRAQISKIITVFHSDYMK